MQSRPKYRRLKQIDEIRTARWHAAGAVQTGVEAFLRDAVPGGVVLAEVRDASPTEILKKSETLIDGIERLRLRGRELRADLHRIRSAPYPSSVAKARALEQLNTLADAGAPAVDALVERANGKIAFAERQVMALVHNVPDAHGAVAISTEPDVLALTVWLHRDALIAKINAEIDSESDDKAALTDQQRQTQETEVGADLLAIERQESTLVWAMQAEGHAVEHRTDCSPLAVLGVELLVSTARPEPQSGSSPQWASRGRS